MAPSARCAGLKPVATLFARAVAVSRLMTSAPAAICLFVNGVKGMSALQMSRDLDVQYKTAFVMMHKLREVLAAEMRGLELAGEVEIDGCYIGGHIRPSNLKEDRVDRRLAKHQTGTRRVVVALRQRGGRTLPFIAKREGEGVEIASRIVATGSTIFADEAAHWDDLVRDFPMGRINHSEAYSLHGKHTNNVESFFSRLRRMIRGQHHKVSPQYLHQYASEAAWKEDHRSVANGAQAGRVISLAMASPVSRQWAGYWQRAA